MAAPQEPPTVSTYIPYVGHVIGFMRSKFEYLVQLKYETVATDRSHTNPRLQA